MPSPTIAIFDEMSPRCTVGAIYEVVLGTESGPAVVDVDGLTVTFDEAHTLEVGDELA